MVAWLRQYYTFIEDGTLFSGFRGKALRGGGDAIYLHYDSFMKMVERMGAVKAMQSQTHTVIHEMMHLNSFKGTGANSWLQLGELAGESHPNQKLDEGFTEIFSRIVLYRIQANPRDIPSHEIPILNQQPISNSSIPVYEGLKNIAYNIWRWTDLRIMARGYFLGDWGPLQGALKEIEIFRSLRLWKMIEATSHTASWFVKQDELMEQFRSEFGFVGIPKATQILDDVQQQIYKDTQIQDIIKTISN
eukprot:TRINITY_DN6148_c0_g1_i1.p1 TRINITY_DN6148_c0_g1~~TRINITY_DN6148_c0_g1_i1.p1  ORF type:complete len:247 (+),score=43.43 TRINITY_DN6148_c0_g1_i1:457-1197(+)